MIKNPLVSICCTTYNHEKYISQAIEGFLMQKTNFPIEIIIHDDASTDETAKIVKEYANNYPELIVPIFQKVNQYSKGIKPWSNFVFPKAKGKYIALCEGDDYWTDPYKLQKQVDFLEDNPEFGLVHTKAKVFLQSKNEFAKTNMGQQFSTVQQLIYGNTISTPTVMFRANVISKYKEEIDIENKRWLMGDYPLWLFIAFNSKVKFLQEPTAVYQVIDNSLSHAVDYKKDLAFIESYRDIKLFFINKYQYKEMQNIVWERYYISKIKIFITKNIQNISELVKEIDNSKTVTFKIKVLSFVLKVPILRTLLNFYWGK